MGHDGPPLRGIGVDPRQDRGDVLVGQTVETVAPDPLFGEFPRQGEGLRDRGDRGVERRVETGHLGDSREPPADIADGGQVVGLMQGSQGHECLEIGEDLPVHDNRPRVSRPPVDDPVTHGPDAVGGAGLAAAPGEDRLHGPLLAQLRTGGPGPLCEDVSVFVPGLEAGLREKPLHLPVGQDAQRFAPLFVESELQARGSRVDHDDDIAHCPTSPRICPAAGPGPRWP